MSEEQGSTNLRDAVIFPNIEKLLNGKRTCCHLLPGGRGLGVGDHIVGIGSADAGEGFLYEIVATKMVKLLDDLDEDCVKKNGYDTIDEYFARWDKIHPSFLAASNPIVIRYDFMKTDLTSTVRKFPPGDNWMWRVTEEVALAEDKKFFSEIEKMIVITKESRPVK